jgi:hypothetical protein
MQAAPAADLTTQIPRDNVLVIFGGLILVMLLAALDSTIVARAAYNRRPASSRVAAVSTNGFRSSARPSSRSRCF